MQLAITNNDSTYEYSLESRYLSIGPGQTKTITGATEDDLRALLNANGVLDTSITARVTVESGDTVGLKVKSANPNISGGNTGSVTCSVVTAIGEIPCALYVFKWGVYSDAYGQTAENSGTLNTATAGTILAGGGTAELIARTSAAGVFTCTLTDASDETVYLLGKALSVSGGLLMGEADAVTFS